MAELGFSCGKKCPTCNEPVSLDAQGRYTCFSCGGFVRIDQEKSAEKVSAIQPPLFKTGWGIPS